MSKEIDDPRREFLVRMLTMGVFATGSWSLPGLVYSMGKVPNVLPAGKSFFDIQGDVRVNQRRANLDTVITANDVVSTGANSHAVFVVGRDAFILRDNSSMEIHGNAIINSIRIFSGKVLSVFGHRENGNRLQMRTSTATIGIRGTGVYLESDPEQTYFCTCYGETELESTVDQNQKQRVTSHHHDDPKYILASPSQKGKLILPAPMINHNDQELALVEELVGRVPPFGLEGDAYRGPRREY